MRRIFIIVCLVLAASAAAADDLLEVKRQIAAELVYPREIIYNLPAILPAKNASAAKNTEYLHVVEALKQTGVLRAVVDGEGIRAAVSGENFDVIRQQANIRYEVISLSLLLGEWAVEVEGADGEGAVTEVRGRRLATNTTRIYRVVLESLPDSERRKYVSVPMHWTIERVDGRETVSEKALVKP